MNAVDITCLDKQSRMLWWIGVKLNGYISHVITSASNWDCHPRRSSISQNACLWEVEYTTGIYKKNDTISLSLSHVLFSLSCLHVNHGASVVLHIIFLPSLFQAVQITCLLVSSDPSRRFHSWNYHCYRQSRRRVGSSHFSSDSPKPHTPRKVYHYYRLPPPPPTGIPVNSLFLWWTAGT